MTIEKLKELIRADMASKQAEISEIYEDRTTVEVIQNFSYRLHKLGAEIDTYKVVLHWCDVTLTEEKKKED